MAVKKLDAEFDSKMHSPSDKVWLLKPLSGQTLTISGIKILGNTPDADIKLENKQGQARHIRLICLEEGLSVEDLDHNNNVSHNGNPCSECIVKSGEYIRIGALSFQLHGQGSSANQAELATAKHDEDIAGPQGTMMISESQLDRILPSNKAAIGVTNASFPVLVGAGTLRGKVFELKAGKLTVGRNKSNDIVIEEDSVSATHAELFNNQGNCKVVNLLSSNGTFVNGQKTSSCYLKPGDKISFGRAKFIYRIPNSKPEEEHVPSGSSSAMLYVAIGFCAASALAAAAFFLL